MIETWPMIQTMTYDLIIRMTMKEKIFLLFLFVKILILISQILPTEKERIPNAIYPI